jgi:glycosyltransferase involved in cell wall biosynthesis
MISNNNILLSIICRSYNGAQFIHSALKSLSAYLNDKCEVIIVDNGSSDHTISTVKKFLDEEKYSFKVKLIEQINSGPGGSSNTGLDNASGKYIGFLDCDDIYLEIFKSKIIKILEEGQIDILEYGFLIFSENIKIKKENYKSLYNNLNGKYQTQNILDIIFARTNWYPFTRIFKKELWENIRFPLNKAYEDDMTLYKVFLRSKTIFLLNEPAIAYRNHTSSITAKHTVKQLSNLINFYWELDIDAKYGNIFRLRLARAISHFSYELNQGSDEYKKILKNQKKIKFSFKTIFFLKTVDIFYYFLPNIYDFMNLIRLRFINSSQKKD